jgi:Kef-type K+ transport system membrane component KefB
VTGGGTPKALATRLLQLAGLAAVLGVGFAVQGLAAERGAVGGGVVFATGLLLLAGFLTSELLDLVRLPHLTGYIAAGALAGPHVLGFVDQATVVRLETVNTLALSLIALAGGLELRTEDVQRVLRSIAWSTLLQTVLVWVSQAALFFALARFMPSTAALSGSVLLGVALLWGVLSVSRSPSATLAILAQTRAKGPLARFSLAFVMSSDVVVLVLLAATLALARPLLLPGEPISMARLWDAGHEILGSVSIGSTLGLLLILYMRLVGTRVLVLLFAIGFGLSEVIRYLRFEPLLTFLTAGFVVQNLSHQGERLLADIQQTGSVVFVVFFATAGAHLDLPLLATLGPIALGLCAGRLVATAVAHVASARAARDEPVIRRWGWAGMVSQAGLTLGMSAVIARAYPQLADVLRSLVIATVAVNEIVGPICFKLALERAGEVSRDPDEPGPAPAAGH